MPKMYDMPVCERGITHPLLCCTLRVTSLRAAWTSAAPHHDATSSRYGRLVRRRLLGLGGRRAASLAPSRWHKTHNTKHPHVRLLTVNRQPPTVNHHPLQVLRHFAQVEHERERLSYFATAEGRDDLYRHAGAGRGAGGPGLWREPFAFGGGGARRLGLAVG
jgi:hypothetical protein